MNGSASKGILVSLGVVVTVGVVGAILSRDSAVTIIGFCTMVCVSLLGILQQLSAANKMDSLKSIAEATHTLVNSNMEIQLKLNSIVTRRLADLTKDPVDRVAADASDKMLAEHRARQAIVDNKTKE